MNFRTSRKQQKSSGMQVLSFFLVAVLFILVTIGTAKASSEKLFSALDQVEDYGLPINYGNDEASQTIHVFSCLDCKHCVRLHKQIPDLVSSGIQVKYYPLAIRPRMSKSYQQMAGIWNLPVQERAEALDKAFADADSFTIKSNDDIALQLGGSLARDLGLSGTPAIIFPDGRIHRGYASSTQMLRYLSTL